MGTKRIYIYGNSDVHISPNITHSVAESEVDVELRTRDGIDNMGSVTEFEVDISDVVLRECVGEGSFGKGMARGICVT